MTTEDKLEFIVETMNSASKLSAFDYNHNGNVRKVFCLVHNEENLQTQLEREQPNNYNRFYSIDYSLKVFIETVAIDLEVANEYLNRIEDYYTKNWLKIELVKYAVAKTDIATAERITGEIPDEDSGPGQYLAHRHILTYYAGKGDIDNFKKKIKASKLGKFPRYGIELYKCKLIEGYARNNGIQKAFELIEDKYFEKTASVSILRWNAQNFTLNEIDAILDKYPRVLKETLSARADLYVLHFREGGASAISQSDFDKTLPEILKINKDSKCGDLRCRDSLLLDLGSSTLIKKQALECKKHIISPIAKRELNYTIKFNEDNHKYIS